MCERVKWFSKTKGYGYIEYKMDEDIYVHYTSILTPGNKTLVKGQYVEFVLVKTENGFEAKNVIDPKYMLI